MACLKRDEVIRKKYIFAPQADATYTETEKKKYLEKFQQKCFCWQSMSLRLELMKKHTKKHIITNFDDDELTKNIWNY